MVFAVFASKTNDIDKVHISYYNTVDSEIFARSIFHDFFISELFASS